MIVRTKTLVNKFLESVYYEMEQSAGKKNAKVVKLTQFIKIRCRVNHHLASKPASKQFIRFGVIFITLAKQNMILLNTLLRVPVFCLQSSSTVIPMRTCRNILCPLTKLICLTNIALHLSSQRAHIR